MAKIITKESRPVEVEVTTADLAPALATWPLIDALGMIRGLAVRIRGISDDERAALRDFMKPELRAEIRQMYLDAATALT